MLKIIALIECDVCNGVLSQIAVAEKPGEMPAEQLHELQLTAEEYGWQLLKNSTVHYCYDCCRAI